MINSYSIWKNFTVFFILIIGCVYSLPNFYKEDFVVSVSKEISYNRVPDRKLLDDIQVILQKENIINKSVVLHTDCIQIFFSSESDQLFFYKKLSSVFLGKYLVACKKVSSIPTWLRLIYAKPIQLGLDLQGGLYLIVRVDMQTILNKFQEQYINTFQSILKEKNIPYTKVQKGKNYDIEIVFKNFDHRDQFIAYLSKIYTDILSAHIISNAYKINIIFNKQYVDSVCADIIRKNSIILHHRMHQLRITDFVIQFYGNDCIAIELPGIHDITAVKSILSNTATLEFRLINNTVNTFEINNNVIPADSEIKLDNEGNLIPIYKQIILTGEHIINSDVNFDEYQRPQVNIYLDNFGSNIISKFTKNNVGKLMATLFVEYKDSGMRDLQGYPILYRYDKIINVAVIRSQLTHSFCISGINNVNEARYLSSLLKMGSLCSPVYLEEERVIGPVLGKKNIMQGIIACGLGILLSISFMVIWYRYFGMIAGIALIFNLVLIISLISLIPGITLTMPSIAGIVLTLSVAIDANVLINERIKEEIKQGKPIQYAIYMGYRKAFNSIVDANITTIITSIILYIMGTHSIQGFAMATIIGVGTSMFTSIVGTRTFVNLIYGRKYISRLSI